MQNSRTPTHRQHGSKPPHLKKVRMTNSPLSPSQVANAMFAYLRRHTQKNNGVQPVILLLSHPRPAHSHRIVNHTQKMADAILCLCLHALRQILGSCPANNRYLRHYTPLAPLVPAKPAAQGTHFDILTPFGCCFSLSSGKRPTHKPSRFFYLIKA